MSSPRTARTEARQQRARRGPRRRRRTRCWIPGAGASSASRRAGYSSSACGLACGTISHAPVSTQRTRSCTLGACAMRAGGRRRTRPSGCRGRRPPTQRGRSSEDRDVPWVGYSAWQHATERRARDRNMHEPGAVCICAATAHGRPYFGYSTVRPRWQPAAPAVQYLYVRESVRRPAAARRGRRRPRSHRLVTRRAVLEVSHSIHNSARRGWPRCRGQH